MTDQNKNIIINYYKISSLLAKKLLLVINYAPINSLNVYYFNRLVNIKWVFFYLSYNFIKIYMLTTKTLFIAFSIGDQRQRDLLKGQSLHVRSLFSYVDMLVREPYDTASRSK